MLRHVEICVESAHSARAAAAGGADQVEFCVDRPVGGLTPLPGMLAAALENLAIPLRVLIRPRAGDFAYSPSEFASMLESFAIARDLGAAGIVAGILHPDASVDVPRMAQLIAHAHPLPVTFHKAIDAARDPLSALEALIPLGIDRLLSSGRATTAREGIPTLSALLRCSQGRVTIMAGGSIHLDDLPLLRAAGLTAIHAGSAVLSDGQTDPIKVRRLVDAWKSP